MNHNFLGERSQFDLEKSERSLTTFGPNPLNVMPRSQYSYIHYLCYDLWIHQSPLAVWCDLHSLDLENIIPMTSNFSRSYQLIVKVMMEGYWCPVTPYIGVIRLSNVSKKFSLDKALEGSISQNQQHLHYAERLIDKAPQTYNSIPCRKCETRVAKCISGYY